MEKERLILFFSDVEGTLNKLDYENAVKLRELLEKKRKYYKADKVSISLVSNCMNCILEEYIKELAEPLTNGETITLGKCFSYEGSIENEKRNCLFRGYSKAEKISYYTGDIVFETGNQITYIMYADDEMSNGIMQPIYETLKYDVESKIEFLIPGAKEGSNYFISEEYRTRKDNIFTSSKPNIEGLIECMQKSIFKDDSPSKTPENSEDIGRPLFKAINFKPF